MIQKNVSLKNKNTFGVQAKTKYYAEIKSESELIALLADPTAKNEKLMILGGGSNVLFKSDFDGLIINMNIQGINVRDESDTNIIVQCGAGENWHEFVETCMKSGWYGLENLALIPGKTGAAPVQNIGAYGIEQEKYFLSLEAYLLESGEKLIFNNNECNFGYRNSVFKTELKGKLIITSINYSLDKHFKPELTYSDLSSRLTPNCTAQELFDAVVQIRQQKLPDPNELGNAGSFFKNPVVDTMQFEDLKNDFSDIRSFPVDDSHVKIPAGWLIEKAGWKGRRVGDAGVAQGHALILVNYGDASGRDIFELSQEIINDVENKFGITLEREVNVVE